MSMKRHAQKPHDKLILYQRLDKLGADTGRLRELDPTEDQLAQLLVRLSTLRDRKLVRFITSMKFV